MLKFLRRLFTTPRSTIYEELTPDQPTVTHFPSLRESKAAQDDYTQRLFEDWWATYSTSPVTKLNGPRSRIASSAYAAGAASVYALTESMGMIVTPPRPAPEPSSSTPDAGTVPSADDHSDSSDSSDSSSDSSSSDSGDSGGD